MAERTGCSSSTRRTWHFIVGLGSLHPCQSIPSARDLPASTADVNHRTFEDSAEIGHAARGRDSEIQTVLSEIGAADSVALAGRVPAIPTKRVTRQNDRAKMVAEPWATSAAGRAGLTACRRVVLLQLLIERASGHAQPLGGAIHVPRLLAHHTDNVRALDILERSAPLPALLGGQPVKVEDQRGSAHLSGVAEDESAFDHVPQFPDVSRPRVSLQGGNRLRRDTDRRPAELRA